VASTGHHTRRHQEEEIQFAVDVNQADQLVTAVLLIAFVGLIVVNAIMTGELRDPERLMGYIRTVVRRQAAVYIGATVQNRRGEVELEGEDSFADGRENPEESIMRDQQAALLKEMLEGISDRDREILTRFYLDEEPAAQICVSMGLSNTQFRLLKSRAKARFSAVTRRKFSEKGFYKKR
jgi:RNA polymerase sigma factor (sigma-70 family)